MSTIYFVEGDTEKKLIKCLKAGNQIIHGKVIKYNFWEQLASSIIFNIKKRDRVIVVFDTDKGLSIETNRFIENILTIKRVCKEIILMPQHRNLEDEIVFCCGFSSKRKMFEVLYNTTSSKEFKTKFLSESQLLMKLNNNDFHTKKLWSRNNIFENKLNRIKNLDKEKNRKIVFIIS